MSNSLVRTIFAVILLFHGVGHFMGVIPALRIFGAGTDSGPSWQNKWSSRSRILSGFLNESAARRLCAALFVAAMIGFMGAGLGLLGWIIVPFQAWRISALVSSLISLLALFLYWNAFILFFPHKLGAIAVNLMVLFGIMVSVSAAGGPPIPFNLAGAVDKRAEIGFRLLSPAFSDESPMPDLHTCHGDESSPPLTWTDPPNETQSFALIMEDLDTPIGNITHWVLFNIPVERRGLEAALPAEPSPSGGIVQGRNGMRRNRYLGPCPPWGDHRYVFHLFALDIDLTPEPKWGKKRLLKAMQGHILATAHLIGTFEKKK